MQYLFNSAGDWIAFRDGDFIYDPYGKTLGWLAEDGESVADVGGHYFATIIGNRLLRKLFPPIIAGWYKGWPQGHDLPDAPERPDSISTPIEADDIPDLVGI